MYVAKQALLPNGKNDTNDTFDSYDTIGKQDTFGSWKSRKY